MPFYSNEKEIRKWLSQGKTLQEYAELIGVDYSSVRRSIKRNLDEETYEEIIKINADNNTYKRIGERLKELGIDLDYLVSKGYSFQKISKEFDISPQTVKKYVKRCRLDIFEKFIENGKDNKKTQQKLTVEQIDEILRLSESGFGIDAIGNMFGVDGTTIRYNLIKRLGKREYQKRHNIKRFKENNGWNGKSITYNGVTYQSLAEVKIARILEKLGLTFKAHSAIKIEGKIFYPDFYVNELGLFIEYAGMLDRAFYRRKFATKMTQYSLNKIQTLTVVPETLDELEGTLRRLMPNVAEGK